MKHIFNHHYPFLFFSISLILFAAGSTKGVERLSKSERASINIPDDIKEILIGILLGDADARGHRSFYSSHVLLRFKRLRVFLVFFFESLFLRIKSFLAAQAKALYIFLFIFTWLLLDYAAAGFVFFQS